MCVSGCTTASPVDLSFAHVPAHRARLRRIAEVLRRAALAFVFRGDVDVADGLANGNGDVFGEFPSCSVLPDPSSRSACPHALRCAAAQTRLSRCPPCPRGRASLPSKGRKSALSGNDGGYFPQVLRHELTGTRVGPGNPGAFEIALDFCMHAVEEKWRTEGRVRAGELDDVANAGLLGGVG